MTPPGGGAARRAPDRRRPTRPRSATAGPAPGHLSDKEHTETSMLALHLLQSALVHVNTLLPQQVLAGPKWVKKLTPEDRRGLTALFWSNINPYGIFRLDLDKRLELPLSASMPGPRRTSGDAARRTGSAS
ncbi:transposase [Streptomyces sp. WAC 06725]|uniref:transposase n=1 Tax=Streptomyces sp. WAC 06725 TaxID=2203209 RepID=UPI0021AD7101|nr:transposase [Streptomyces sp. WAC 06725]